MSLTSEAARCVALDEIGMSLSDLSDTGFQIVVTSLEVKFRSQLLPAIVSLLKHGLDEMKRALGMETTDPARGDNRLLVSAELTLGVCDAYGKPTRPPADLNASLAQLMQE